jgi:hypothetical protein
MAVKRKGAAPEDKAKVEPVNDAGKRPATGRTRLCTALCRDLYSQVLMVIAHFPPSKDVMMILIFLLLTSSSNSPFLGYVMQMACPFNLRVSP